MELNVCRGETALGTKQGCCFVMVKGWSRVCGDIHIDIRSNGWADSEQQVQWSGDSDGKCSMCRLDSYVHHPLHRPHLRCTSEPIPHHCLRDLSPLPMDPCPCLHSSSSLCLHLCLFRSQRYLPPFPLRWGHCPFCQRRPGLCNWVHHHFHSLVCRHCCCHWYSCGRWIGGYCCWGYGFAQHSHIRVRVLLIKQKYTILWNDWDGVRVD